ncbi:MAG: ABC transporter permease [Clostridia bacterium]
MRKRDAIGMALSSLRQNPMRALLTMLGFAIGIGAIMTVMSVGGAGQRTVEDELQRFGVGRVWITACAQSDVRLRAEDALFAQRAGTKLMASAMATQPFYITAGADTYLAEMVGCTETLSEVENIRMTVGRFLREQDDRTQSAAIVLDRKLAQRLFPQGEAVGMRVSVAGRKLTVVGITDDASFSALQQSEGRAWIPLGTFASLFGTRVDQLTVRVPQRMQPDDVGKRVAQTLALRTGGSYQAHSLVTEIEAARRILRIFMLVMGFVAAVCMMVGGIGVMNIMLISVQERRHEIGVLKALGATRFMICRQFLLESVSYAVLGGIVGMFLGWIMTVGAARLIGLPAQIPLYVLLLSISFACGIGIFFGVYPAMRAASMQPVAALRQDS